MGQFKMDCLVTCEFCNPNLPPNVTTLPPTTECDGVVADKESLDFCEKKKDKNKCEQFKMDCLVTCEFCNPNITTNVTTLPPTNITTLPPTTIDDCKDILEEAVCKQKKKEKKCNKDNVQVNCKKTCDQCL